MLNIDQIQQAINEQHIVVHPFNARFVRPTSVILRLGGEIVRFRESDQAIDPFDEQTIRDNVSHVEEFTETLLHPRSFALSTTIEHIGIPNNIVGMLSNLSHLARLGLDVHHGSFIIHPGFGQLLPATITLELYNQNVAPIKIYAGMPVCHLLFIEVQESERSYDRDVSIYTGQHGPQLSRYYKEFMKFAEDE